MNLDNLAPGRSASSSHSKDTTAVVELDSRVCAGMNDKQKKNAAIPHCVNAEAKQSPFQHHQEGAQKPSLGNLCSCSTCWKKDMRVPVESLAGAYAQSIAQNRAETDPLS